MDKVTIAAIASVLGAAIFSLFLAQSLTTASEKNADVIVRCEPKKGFTFPSFEYDAKDPETSFTVDLILGPKKVTFRDRITGEIMTIGKELSDYYECAKVADSNY